MQPSLDSGNGSYRSLQVGVQRADSDFGPLRGQFVGGDGRARRRRGVPAVLGQMGRPSRRQRRKVGSRDRESPGGPGGGGVASQGEGQGLRPQIRRAASQRTPRPRRAASPGPPHGPSWLVGLDIPPPWKGRCRDADSPRGFGQGLSCRRQRR